MKLRDLWERIRILAHAHRELKLAKTALTSTGKAGADRDRLAEMKENWDYRRELAIDSLLDGVGELLLEQDRKEEAHRETP